MFNATVLMMDNFQTQTRVVERVKSIDIQEDHIEIKSFEGVALFRKKSVLQITLG